MRVASLSRYADAMDMLQRRQAELSQAQQQMAGGLRVNRPSDDPTAAARAERARIVQSRVETEGRALGVSRNAMLLAEGALGQGGELMQSVRETLLAAGDASYSAGERHALAVQLTQLRGQLLALANQTDGSGGFVFGGQGSTAAPFMDGIGGVQFGGTGGQVNVASVEQMPTTVDGQQIWLGVRSGNGVFDSAADPANTGAGWISAGTVSSPAALTGSSYELVLAAGGPTGITYAVLKDGLASAITAAPLTPGQAISVDGMAISVSGAPLAGDRFSLTPSTQTLSPFAALDRAISVLNNPSANSGQVAQAVEFGVRDADAVLSHLLTARSQTGATLNRLDAIETRNRDRGLWAKTVQSDAEDLDMVQAVSNFQNRQSGYQVALQTYAMVQRMTLFDYIK